MNRQRPRLLLRAVLLSSCAGVFNLACAIEMIDSLIEERGVTECDSSSDSTDTTSSTATSAEETSESEGTTGADDTSSTTSDGPDTSGETEGSSTGSTGLLATCGNGVVEGEETCDDGNDIPGDGCQECAKDSIVFVSSEYYQGFALEGLYGADQRCRSLAGKAGLPRHLTYKAWLSTPTMSAADRLLHSKGRYILVNGLVVAQDWDALTSGTLENAIMVDEGSLTRMDPVWTGTLASGEPALGTEFCEDWDDDSGLLKHAGAGLSMNVDAMWSFFDNGTCDSEARLYCIEQ